ncbi:MAG TPA: cytochrome P450 [Bryobacteraceae bacterium]|nr:cytochrome P450 [Bryobacteraceae bacterium]
MSADISLCQLTEPDIMASPYRFYRELREADPVYWDPFLHAWAVTRYVDIVTVLTRFSADRTLTAEQLDGMGLGGMKPIIEVMARQMLFRDPPAHTRLRNLCAAAFTPARVAVLREHIEDIADSLIDKFIDRGTADIVADLASPMPAIVTAEMLGVPVSDHEKLKQWSIDFAEILGNFQHQPDRVARVAASVRDMTDYFRAVIRQQETDPHEGLVNSLVQAQVDGNRLTEEEIIANAILTMIGGQETSTNLISSGLLTLLRHPEQMRMLLDDPSLITLAVEELLRFESPIQHTARVAHEDFMLGGKLIRRGQSVVAVLAAGNRDPERFPNPDLLDVKRGDKGHLAFGWAAHFCFGAPLARIEGQIAFSTILRRLKKLELASEDFVWRDNFGLRGLSSLPVRFEASNE